MQGHALKTGRPPEGVEAGENVPRENEQPQDTDRIDLAGVETLQDREGI